MATFDRFSVEIGDAVADSVKETGSFGEAMQNIAKQALRTVICGLIEIGTKKLMSAAIDKSIQSTTQISFASTFSVNIHAMVM